MAIKTKSIYEPKEESDGLRILVTRYWPRGIKKEHFNSWHKELAPSKHLLQSFKEGSIDWLHFEFLYRLEMNAQYASIMEASEIASKTTITLLCHEREGQNCHRHILKQLIASL
ncbi:MAG: DUF488 family protein [Patescibacteria group bacterium]|nr:DUF488 family protein [Patescibacteria group bacterium]